MPMYRRWHLPGGAYFFTLVTAQRRPILTGDFSRSILRTVISETMARWPFVIEAMVLLPDHLHAIWSLPADDSNYSQRWGYIKKEFTKRYLASGGKPGLVSTSQTKDRRAGLWQRRFWEHVVRDEDDFAAHFDYIHYNPAKHGLVRCPVDWPYSTFHKYVQNGVYSPDWGCLRSMTSKPMDFRAIEKTIGE